MADSNPMAPAKVEKVIEPAVNHDRKVDFRPAVKHDRKVNFRTKDEKRIATASKDVPGAGGIEITKHKKVKLSNGLIIENS